MMQGALPRRRVNADWVVTTWTWALVLVIIMPTRADPDLWGHLRFGLDWLATRSLSYLDPYSFTQDRPWINHEWLSEATIAAAYRYGGVSGLVILKFSLAAVTLWILAGALAQLPVLVRSACLVLATWSALAPMTLTVRPQLWSWLFTVAVARLLLSPPSMRLLATLPPLFVLWINMHGGVVVGAALVGAWTIYHAARGMESRGLAVAVGVSSVAATLINPYGFWLWQFLAETVRIGRGIQEWRPIWTAQVEGWAMPWALAMAVVLGAILSSARPRIDRVAAMLAMGYASANTMRLVPFFVAISLIYLVPSLRILTARGWPAWTLHAPSRVAAGLALVPLVPVLAVVHGSVWTSSRDCMPIRGDWAPDLTVATALREASPSGRLVTTYAWGQYSIWHFGPSLRVSYDGRRETVYTDETDWRQVYIERGDAEGLQFLGAVRPEYVWLSHSSAGVRRWLELQPDYRVDLETPTSFLGVRADLGVVSPADTVPGPCFPG
jgi:hypothetical protein